MRTPTYRENRQTRGHHVLETLSQRKLAWRKNGIAFQQSEVKTAISSGMFHSAFVHLKIMRDYYRGIHTTYGSIKENTVLVRDARTQSLEKEYYQCEASYYKYVQLGLNYLSGLIALLEIENKRRKHAGETIFIDLEAAKKDMVDIARAFFEDITPKDPNDPKQQQEAESNVDEKYEYFMEKVLTPFYRQYRPSISDEELKKELQLGRNFANIKVKPYVVATVTRHEVVPAFRKNVGDNDYVDIVELELPMVEFSEEQKQLIEGREQQDWYRGQSDLARALIEYYLPHLQSGAMIPARLLYHLIGSRNAYEKWTVALGTGATGYTVLNQTYHAGSQGHILKLPNSDVNAETVSQKATLVTLEQLKMLTDADHLSINTLVSSGTSVGGMTHDKALRDQIQTACKERSDVSFSNTPINAARRVSPGNYTGINQLLNTAHDLIQQAPNKSSPLIVELERCSYNLKAALNPGGVEKFSDTNNYELEIAARTNLLLHTLNKAQDRKRYAHVSGCLSGQDRGGLVSTQTSNLAVEGLLISGKPDERPIKRQQSIIQITQAKAGHTVEMTGNAGTGFGGEGLKPCGIPQNYDPVASKFLMSQTGFLNEKLTTPKLKRQDSLRKILSSGRTSGTSTPYKELTPRTCSNPNRKLHHNYGIFSSASPHTDRHTLIDDKGKEITQQLHF